MGLVDYDSDAESSGSEATAAQPPPAARKKAFEKLVDRSNAGKIVVSLPSAAGDVRDDGKDDDDADGRPAKRAKTNIGAAARGGGRFSGFGAFLPPPKNTAAARSEPAASSEPSATASAAASTATPTPPRPGVHLKTSAEAAFSRRDDDGVDDDGADGPSAASRLVLPPPKAPSIPRDQKAADDVKLVGNPLMFMPLSVSRKPGSKKKKPVAATASRNGRGPPDDKTGAPPGADKAASIASQPAPASAPAPAPLAKKKVSLFSLGGDDAADAEPTTEAASDDDAADDNAAYGGDYGSTYTVAAGAGAAGTGEGGYGYGYGYSDGHEAQAQAQAQAQSLDSGPGAAASSSSSLAAFADDMQLSAKERRELFGRRGAASGAAQIAATFDMDAEYRRNEALRQARDQEPQQQAQHPVRTLMPGKHSLRQLVNQVHTQKDAYEETFAKNRASQRESGGKYGWR